MMENQVTLKKATDIASILLNVPNVIGVQLIGSVAREGKGNDLDLVVLVSGLRYTSYVVAVRKNFVEEYPYDSYVELADERMNSALSVLALPPVLRAWLHMMTQDFKLDVHLMPQNWQRHIQEIQQHLPHDDADFVSNIAKDARSFVSKTKDGVKQASLPNR